MNRHSFWFRFIGITLAFSVLGVAIFLPLLAAQDTPRPLVFSLLGVYIALYIGVILFNELYIHRRKKVGKDSNKRK
ncbi:MAG: hypothetical protein SPL00_04975 [Bacilli bacterium]|nr:hypothetical protein [Bacilli bacterium]